MSGQLKSKHILMEEDGDQLYIERDFAAIAEILTFPDQVFACLVGKNGEISMEFIHFRVIARYHLASGEEAEALFTCARTEKGTWIMGMMPERDQVLLFRRQPLSALEQLFAFPSMLGKGGEHLGT